MNLYQITKEALNLALILETEELTPELEQALILNQQQLQTKAGSYAKIIANYQANADGADAEIKRLKQYKEQNEKVVDRLKNALRESMLISGTDKLESEFFRFSVRRSEAVEVDLLEALPANYVTEKTTKSADKVAIKEAIKRGENITGARIVENFSLQIK
jgi:hypothetical protein